MKKFIFYFILIVTQLNCGESRNTDISKNNESDSSVSENNESKAISLKGNQTETNEDLIQQFRDWELDKDDFKKLKDNYANCPFDDKNNCNIREFALLTKAYDAIRIKYPESEWVYSFVQGRYKEEKDRKKYKKTRKRKNPDHENVIGYATMILVLTSKSPTLLIDPIYFDICIICPPPSSTTCDLDQPVETSGKGKK